MSPRSPTKEFKNLSNNKAARDFLVFLVFLVFLDFPVSLVFLVFLVDPRSPRLLSPVSCLLSPVFFLVFLVFLVDPRSPRLLSPISCLLSPSQENSLPFAIAANYNNAKTFSGHYFDKGRINYENRNEESRKAGSQEEGPGQEEGRC